MSRQAVIETGSFTVKAGLWEQTFIPTTRIPSFVRVVEGRKVWGGKTATGATDVTVSPILDGHVVNLDLLEELWRHVLGSELGLVEPWNDVCLLLIIPPSWGRDIQSECLRICFERFGLAGVYLGETQVLASLGCAQSNSIVVDFGHAGTDVSVVWDGHLVRSCAERYPIGGSDIDALLMKELGKDHSFIEQTNGYDLAQAVKAFKETGVLKDGVVSFQLADRQISSNRGDLFDLACQLYFNEDASRGLFGLHHLILSLLGGLDADKRPVLLDSIILTGLASQLKGLGKALTEALTSILPVSGYPGDHQSSKVTLRHVPEYYPEVWQAAGPVAAWFGAGITAKMVFPDSKAHYTKEEYGQMGGPQLLLTKPL